MDILAKRLGTFLLLLFIGIRADSASTPPPNIQREIRGMWITTIYNVDWPSKKSLSPAEQRREFLQILDKAVALRMNTIVLQVRSSCDAIYPSRYEPWSEFVTGKTGKSPQPFYDPLRFAVDEAHKRGLELHAWFNPFRAKIENMTPSKDHVSQSHPEFVRTYGRMLWLDPAEKGAQDYTMKVILDVLRRYDIDGVQIDDYFYPALIRDAKNKIVDFPDDVAWQRYQKGGGRLTRADWRRNNIDTFIERLYTGVKNEKAWVKVGISPPGIWRSGNPPQIRGRDVYSEIYADTRLWLAKGWCDYFSPQLYWEIEKPEQSFPVLLQWWCEQNVQGRMIVPGLNADNVGTGKWTAQEIANQVQLTRKQPRASGHIHYHAKPVVKNSRGLSDELAKLYSQPAVPPPMPWVSRSVPYTPRATLVRSSRGMRLEWKASSKISHWVVQIRNGDTWSTELLPAYQSTFALPNQPFCAVALTAVDRFGQASAPHVIEPPRSTTNKR